MELWGFRKDPPMALVGAAVVARMPHPYDAAPRGDDHDALLRRLGSLHQTGIPTDEESTTTKQAVLKRP